MYFDLRHAQVKNKKSKRRVPICEALVPLVAKILAERTGKERLFDFNLNADGKTRASTLCNYWFGKVDVVKMGGAEGAKYSTHSLRGAFKDKLRDADVPADLHKSICGHTLGGSEDSYGHGYSLGKLKEAVDRVHHPYLAKWVPTS